MPHTIKPANWYKKLKLIPESWVVAGLFGVAIIARYVSLTKADIWHDEGFTMMLIGRNPIEIWAGSARDVHPPLFYELLHFWTSLFGRSEFAARSMSAVAGLLTIGICYLLVKRYFTRGAATTTLAVLAVAPFLVRYSQEARMYGVLGLFLIGGTYALLRALEKKSAKRWWVIYVLCMAAGLYTHYFTVFAMAAHWLYVITLDAPRTWRLWKTTWLSSKWWLANVAIIALWIPWLPAFYGQFTRGQGIGWIPKTTLFTLPNNIWQNLTFTDGMQLPPFLYWLVPLIILVGTAAVTWTEHKKKPAIKMIFFYTAVPILGTILLSVIKPIYQDRYLVFAANGLYMLIGISLYYFIRRHRTAGLAALAAVIGISLIGVVNVGRQATHSMGRVAEYVDAHYLAGDEIVSAELYTYFDMSYYCTKCIDRRNRQVDLVIPEIYPAPVTTLRLNTSGGRPNGYGESSLLYDRAEQIYVDDLATIQPVSRRVWLVGKPGNKPYWTNPPANWILVDTFTTNSSQVQLYNVQ